MGHGPIFPTQRNTQYEELLEASVRLRARKDVSVVNKVVIIVNLYKERTSAQIHRNKGESVNIHDQSLMSPRSHSLSVVSVGCWRLCSQFRPLGSTCATRSVPVPVVQRHQPQDTPVHSKRIHHHPNLIFQKSRIHCHLPKTRYSTLRSMSVMRSWG